MGQMLSSVSNYWWGSSVPANETPDAVGLLPSEKAAIRDTWAMVQQDAKGAGIRLFQELFEAHPEYQLFFEGFAEVPRDELPKNRAFQAHAKSVLFAVNSLVDSLDDLECLTGLLEKIGSSHGKRGSELEHFEELAKVFTVFLEKELGKKFSAHAEQAWTKAFTVINSVINTKLRQS